MLPIVEHFYTIQGEGFHAGKASYFIRLGGCDVGCTWCDTKYSWPMEGHSLHDENVLLDIVVSHSATRVVITGGEPGMHDLSTLCDLFSQNKIKTQIETSGAHRLIGKIDWITLSPKKFKPPTENVYALADELKIIIFNKSDFEWAISEAKKCKPEIPKYLQPEWGTPSMIPLITDFCKSNPSWAMSLQQHKFIDIP